MSENNVLLVRVSSSFKANTRSLIKELYSLGLRDSTTLSEYVREAIREKRERDNTAIDGSYPESVYTTQKRGSKQ